MLTIHPTYSRRYPSFANHSTASPGKDESTEWLNQNSKCAGNGACLYLVGCPDRLEQHILDKIDLGFTDLSKHVIVERDQDTYDALRVKLSRIAFKNIEYSKVRIRFGNIYQYLNNSVEHFDFDTNETFNANTAEIIERACELKIPNIHLTVSSRNGVSYLQSRLGYEASSVKDGVELLLQKQYGAHYNISLHAYYGKGPMLAVALQFQEDNSMGDTYYVEMFGQVDNTIELGELPKKEQPVARKRSHMKADVQKDIVTAMLWLGYDRNTCEKALIRYTEQHCEVPMSPDTARKVVTGILRGTGAPWMDNNIGTKRAQAALHGLDIDLLGNAT